MNSQTAHLQDYFVVISNLRGALQKGISTKAPKYGKCHNFQKGSEFPEISIPAEMSTLEWIINIYVII